MKKAAGDTIIVQVPLSPVRFKASRSRKNILTRSIRQQTMRARYIFTGDVKLDIEWMVHEKDRYESPRSPDIDNILKPIIDSLEGPDGIVYRIQWKCLWL